MQVSIHRPGGEQPRTCTDEEVTVAARVQQASARTAGDQARAAAEQRRTKAAPRPDTAPLGAALGVGTA